MEHLRRALRGLDRAERPGLPVGEAMHPLTLLAVAILVANDWFGKTAFPGAITGKLSDVAGLAFAPVVLTSAIALVLMPFGRRVDPTLSHRRLVAAIAATGIAFALVKLVPSIGDAIASVIGHGAHFVPDPTDLFALPALAIAYWIGRDELRRVPLGKPAALHRLKRPATRALPDHPELADAIDRWDVPAIDAILAK